MRLAFCAIAGAGAGYGALTGLSPMAFAEDAPTSAAGEGMDAIVDSALADSSAKAAASAAQAPASVLAGSRVLSVYNLHTDEKLEAVYFDKGAYVPDALAALNKLMRDHRTGETYPIDPKLLDLMVQLRGAVETQARYDLICGYRTPATNAALHSRSKEVAVNSLHMKGMAADIRIGGVALDHLQKAALALRGGGVGLYPVSDFVHVDVGSVRKWKGT